MQSDGVKIVVIGDPWVGKTTMLRRWAPEYDNAPIAPTISADFVKKKLRVDGKDVTFNIWDTAGHMEYRNTAKALLHGSDGVIIVFSIVDRNSFENVKGWHATIVSELPEGGCKFVLVGNKSDLEAERTVTLAKAMAEAERLQLDYYECSARTGEGVDVVFTAITRLAYFAHGTAGSGRVDLNDDGEGSRCCG